MAITVEKKTHPFKPSISKRSKEIIKERNFLVEDQGENVRDTEWSKEDDNLKKFELLYLEGLKRLQKQEILSSMILDEQCTFQPKLITKRKPKKTDPTEFATFSNDLKEVAGEVQDAAPDYEPDVFTRMLKDAEVKQKREEELRKKFRPGVDQATGQPLFHPQLLNKDEARAVTARRQDDINKDGGIGNYLFKQA
jgi:hypothetical protein